MKAVVQAISLNQSKKERQLLLLCFPLLYLFFAFQLSYLHNSSHTLLLPTLSFVIFFLTFAYQFGGLVVSFALLFCWVLYLYQVLPVDERLWQMGLIYTIAVDSFIILLITEMGKKENLGENKEVALLKERHLEEKVKYEEYIDSLKEVISELKQEAEQRRIDRSGVVAEPVPGHLLEVERLYKQLRVQFEEKQMVLAKTREKLFAVETELMARERVDVEEPSMVERELSRLLMGLSDEVERLEEEVALLLRMFS